MTLICERKYEEPKLKKPTVCNNKTILSGVPFSFGEKPVMCKVWLDGNNNVIYVLHRDWFSETISYDEAIKRKIIDEHQHRKKFVYNDNFGGIVLRNEAIFSFDAPTKSKDISENKYILSNRQKLVEDFANMLNINWVNLPALYRWEDFFEKILRLLLVKKL